MNTGEILRLYNSETKKFLPTVEELSEQATRAEKLESEVEKLKAELAQLKKRE